MPVQVQLASAAAWHDEAHVRENRELYRRKYAAVMPILQACLDVTRPAGSFYLWPRVPGSGEDFARGLHASKHVTVLPGSYLARDSGGRNPGHDRVRISLVAPVDECREAALRIQEFITGR
jgi:N-succinyldiaminopimelate aminotransferase